MSSFLVPVKASMVLNSNQYATIAQVMQVYADFKAATKIAGPTSGRTISSVDHSYADRGGGGHGGRSDPCHDGRKKGSHGSSHTRRPEKRPSQEDVANALTLPSHTTQKPSMR